jgi:acyl carrier protein
MAQDSAGMVQRAVNRIVEEIVNRITERDGPLDPEAYLVRDLGVDSLGLVTIAARLAGEFKIELPENMLEEAPYMTVSQIVTACADAVLEAQRSPV